MVGTPPSKLKERFGDLAHLEAGELRQVNRDDGAQRYRHQQGHRGAGQGARQQHHDAVVGVVEQRRPLRVEQEIGQRNGLEEHPGFLDQHIDDGDRNEHRECRRTEQQALDDAFLDVARRLLAQPVADATADCGSGLGGMDALAIIAGFRNYWIRSIAAL
jgi:hypothetical protein